MAEILFDSLRKLKTLTSSLYESSDFYSFVYINLSFYKKKRIYV